MPSKTKNLFYILLASHRPLRRVRLGPLRLIRRDHSGDPAAGRVGCEVALSGWLCIEAPTTGFSVTGASAFYTSIIRLGAGGSINQGSITYVCILLFIFVLVRPAGIE